jgi:hypothetical protein
MPEAVMHESPSRKSWPHAGCEHPVRARQAVQVGERPSTLQSLVSGVERLPGQSAWMKPAGAKAADMAATQPHAAQMRHAAEAHPAAATAKMRYAAEAHPAASAAETHHSSAPTAQMHSAASAAQLHSAAPKVPTTTPAASTITAAAERLRCQWRRNGCQRRQQDCANHKSLIFHEYLPELHRNVSRLVRASALSEHRRHAPAPCWTLRATAGAAALLGQGCSSLRSQNRGELCANDGRFTGASL